MVRMYLGALVAGTAAGAVTGLFGGGGGMVLIPLMTMLTDLKERELFACSIAVILPICLVSLILGHDAGEVTFHDTLPWLTGSTLGGILAGITGQRIPVKWLHRCLGILILWGGWRYLWS